MSSIDSTSQAGGRRSLRKFYTDGPGLIIATLIGAAAGVGAGLGMVFAGVDIPVLLYWLAMPGTLFMRALTCMIVPLVFSSLVLGVSNIADGEGRFKKIGITTFLLYTLTTFVGALEGLGFSMLARPAWQPDATSNATMTDAAGNDAAASGDAPLPSSGEQISKSIGDLLISLVPRNALGTMVGTPNQGAALLPMIMFALAFAVALAILKRQGKIKTRAVQDVLQQALDVVLLLVNFIMYMTPIAVFSLITSAIAENTLEVLVETFKSLGVLVATMLGAFAFHAIFFLGGMLLVFSRRNPFKHYAQIAPAMSLAFGSASSASTLPTTMACADKMGMSAQVSRFVLSLGATINMDGNAIFMPTIMVWLADQSGMTLTIADQVMVVVVATLASMGASPAPGLTPAIILVWNTCFPNEPVPAAIAFCMALDWLLDRCITMLNVTGDTVVARLVDDMAKKDDSYTPDDDDVAVSTIELAADEKPSKTGADLA